jgi:hypothetical protein
MEGDGIFIGRHPARKPYVRPSVSTNPLSSSPIMAGLVRIYINVSRVDSILGSPGLFLAFGSREKGCQLCLGTYCIASHHAPAGDPWQSFKASFGGTERDTDKETGASSPDIPLNGKFRSLKVSRTWHGCIRSFVASFSDLLCGWNSYRAPRN